MGRLAFPESAQPPSVHEIEIRKVVQIVVDDTDSSGIGFNDVALPVIAADQLKAAQSGRFGRFGEARL